MKSRPLPARRRWRRAADGAVRKPNINLRLFIRGLRTALPATAFPDNLAASDHDPEYRTDDTSEGTSMKAAIRSSALARIFLVAGFGVALSAMPASAQKAGRQHHRRPRTRYSRLRSAEGRRVRHRGADRVIRDLRYAHLLSTPTASRSRSSHCPGRIRRTSRPGPSSCVPASSSTTARRSTPKPTRRISTGRRILPTSAAAPSISPTSRTFRRPTN